MDNAQLQRPTHRVGRCSGQGRNPRPTARIVRHELGRAGNRRHASWGMELDIVGTRDEGELMSRLDGQLSTDD